MICLLHFGRPGAKYVVCGSAFALPPPSLGVSSLDLGRLQCERPFFFSGICSLFCRSAIRTQFFQRDLRQALGKNFELARKL